MPRPLTFPEWKICLEIDCLKHNKMAEFQTLGDYVLELFWEYNLEPSVKAITVDGEAFGGRPNSET